MGIVVSDGKLLTPVNSRYDALVFFKDGTASIVKQASIGSIENIKNAVGGFHQILADGQATQRTFVNDTRHPRSAAGISADGKYLFLLVIDGRRLGSIGATEQETALLLRSLGSSDGINLDGGGSSVLALRYPDGKVRIANRPVHGGIPGRERAVAGCIGISLSTEK
jgi:exopolysaccharide biosynthesis protein